MQFEIERKYHLLYFPKQQFSSNELAVKAVKQIEQTYLALNEVEEIRIRKIVDQNTSETKYTHTYKNGQGLSRKEVEYEISGEIYKQLLAMSGAVPLKKTRTIATDQEIIFEIDSYEQFSLEVVEVEFDSEQDALSFQPPAWFGEEIQPGEEKSNKKLWKDVQSKG